MSMPEKVAFDAVIGVLGVLAAFLGAGGVTDPISGSFGCWENAAILAAVGVLSGTKFNGGKRGFGACCLLTPAIEDVLLDSVGAARVKRRLGCSSQKSKEKSPKMPPEPVPVWLYCGSCGTCFCPLAAAPRSEKNGLSILSLGDSYALGMAGTGGTVSFPSPKTLLWALRGFDIGPRLFKSRLGGTGGIEILEGLSEL